MSLMLEFISVCKNDIDCLCRCADIFCCCVVHSHNRSRNSSTVPSWDSPRSAQTNCNSSFVPNESICVRLGIQGNHEKIVLPIPSPATESSAFLLLMPPGLFVNAFPNDENGFDTKGSGGYCCVVVDAHDSEDKGLVDDAANNILCLLCSLLLPSSSGKFHEAVLTFDEKERGSLDDKEEDMCRFF